MSIFKYLLNSVAILLISLSAMYFFAGHIPILLVIITFFGAMLAALSFDYNRASKISITTLSITFIINLMFFLYQIDANYLIGGWPKPIGIEYLVQKHNKIIWLIVNFILLIFLLFYKKLIYESILNYLPVNWQHLFYALILFTHSGYVGIICTNDLFNLYVFIEISSLSSYILMSLGGNLRAPIGALYYLLFGSIGATFILLAIGLIFSITGSLNFDEINNIILNNLAINSSQQIIFNTAVAFYVIGALIKISFFPIHFWRKNAYTSSSEVILIYLGSIASVIGVYILIKFLFFIGDYHAIISKLSRFLLPVICLSICICSELAYSSHKLSQLIIYGVLLNICYAILFLLIPGGEFLVIPLLLIDALNKAGLFILQSYFVSKQTPLKNIYFVKYLVSIIILCCAGLPLTPLFMTKILMIKTLLIGKYYIITLIVLISFIASFFYHYKIYKILILASQNEQSKPEVMDKGLIFIIIAQIKILLNFGVFVNNCAFI